MSPSQSPPHTILLPPSFSNTSTPTLLFISTSSHPPPLTSYSHPTPPTLLLPSTLFLPHFSTNRPLYYHVQLSSRVSLRPCVPLPQCPTMKQCYTIHQCPSLPSRYLYLGKTEGDCGKYLCSLDQLCIKKSQNNRLLKGCPGNVASGETSLS